MTEPIAALLDDLLPPCDLLVDRDTHGPRVELAQRIGCMIHYDDSSSDDGALAWFRDPAFRLSYNRAYRDDGARIRITPSIHHAAYHAGVCRVEPGLPIHVLSGTSFRYGGANTGYFGLAVTAADGEHATLEQLDALACDVAVIFGACGWRADDVHQRIVGHDSRAVFNPRDDPDQRKRWGMLGRKIDPTGSDARDPVVDLDLVREAVRRYLRTERSSLPR